MDEGHGELVIVGNDDGSHTITVPNPNGGTDTWLAPASVSLEQIEVMLKDTFGELLGERTVEINGTKH